MKKTILLVALSGVVSGAFADPSLLWGSNGAFTTGTGDCYYTNGVLIAQNTDWLIELINVADDTVLYSVNNGFAREVDGLFYGSDPAPDAAAWNGLTVKTIIYNANKKEDATLFAEFTQQTNFSWSTTPAPPATVDYNAGVVTASLGSNPGEWQAIPEPTVGGLIVTFGAGLVLVRRRLSK